MNENNKLQQLEQQRAFITKFCYWAIIVLIAYMAAKYVLPVLFPFVIAGGIACILNRPINFLTDKAKRKRKYICVLVVVLFFLIVGALLIFTGKAATESVKEIAAALPSVFKEDVVPFLETAAERLEVWLSGILPGMENSDSVVLQTLGKGIEMVSASLMNALTGAATRIPSLFIKTIITIIATFFMTSDFEKIKAFLVRHIPESKRPVLREARDFFGGTLAKCFGAYIAIMGITFIELFLGLTVLRTPYPLLIAMLIAIVDILPVLGTGTILIPWALIALLGENYGMGAGLLLLYLVITIIRNTIEPKLVGRQMGLHPIAAFAGMLLGLKYFGFVGMIGLPLLFAFANHLSKKKTLSVSQS